MEAWEAISQQPSEVDRRFLEMTGRFFGFPSCCTQSFIKACENESGSGDIHTPEQYEAGQASGFIPCQKCTAYVLEGQEGTSLSRLQSLISDRQAPWPFYPKWPAVFDERTMTFDEESERRNRMQAFWIDTMLAMEDAGLPVEGRAV